MRVSFSATDIDELYAEWSQQTGSFLQVDPFETILELHPRMGKGWMRQIRFRPGLEMALKHFEFPELFIAEVTNSFSWGIIGITSSLSGYVKETVRGIQDEYCIAPRQSTMSFFPNCGGRIECQPHQRVIHVEVIAELSMLNTLVAGQFDQIASHLRGILEGTAKTPFSQLQIMTQAVFQATEQILNCPYQGLTRRLYLESRAIELIALQLHTISSYTAFPQARRSLKPDEIDRIDHAKEILLNNLENPPSLLELAQRVGLNDYKLKQGFRQVFGTTVFGCLYHHRMERAKLLLEAGCSTVTEVAHSVGYTSATSFSAAFKKKFGVQPKAYKRRYG